MSLSNRDSQDGHAVQRRLSYRKLRDTDSSISENESRGEDSNIGMRAAKAVAGTDSGCFYSGDQDRDYDHDVDSHRDEDILLDEGLGVPASFWQEFLLTMRCEFKHSGIQIWTDEHMIPSRIDGTTVETVQIIQHCSSSTSIVQRYISRALR